MQDRYAGDVGDFMKLGLLRALAGGDLRLGINWYLAPEESHNADGKHVGYLSSTNSIGRRLERCDPDLYVALRHLVENDRRSVAGIEALGVLPDSTVTYSTRLTRSMDPAQRNSWHQAAVSRLKGSDLVFVDPDNGITHAPGPRTEKFVLPNELGDYFAGGATVVAYHHADRSPGSVTAQLTRRLRDLKDATGAETCAGVVARRGSCRLFLIALQPRLGVELSKRLGLYSSTWSPHAYVEVDGQAI